jgi:hypothetical protein
VSGLVFIKKRLLELIATLSRMDLYLFDKKPFNDQLMGDLTNNVSIYEGMRTIPHYHVEARLP